MIHKKLWGIDLYQKKHYYDEHTHRFTCGYYKGKKNHKCKCPKPLHILKRTLKEGEILFHSNYKGYRYFGKLPRDDYIELLKKDKNLFEVIDCDIARRVYFDVDGKTKNSLKKAIKEIKKMFGKDVEMAISGSFGKKDGKDYYSYHIILMNIVFNNLEDMQKSGITDWLEFLKINNPECCLDIGVYKNNQYFKSVNQSKNDKVEKRRVQKMINEDDIEFHMVQVFPNEYQDKFINGMDFSKKMLKYKKSIEKQIKKILKKQGKKKGATVGMMAIKQLPPRFPKPIIDFEFDDPLDILMCIPNTDPLHAISSKLHYNIGNWAYHQGINYEDFIRWENRHIGKMYFEDRCTKYNPYTSKETWDKYAESKYWWRTGRIQNLLECFFGKLPNKRYEKFKKEFIKNGTGDVMVNQKYLNRKHINDKKYICIHTGMGSGKSYITIEYLIEKLNENPNLSFVWITNRISLANGLMGRLNGFNDIEKNKKFPNMKRNLEAKNYKRMGCNKIEKYNKIRNCKRLVIELESLHYLKDKELCGMINKCAFDIVVTDEIESLWFCFMNDKCHQDGKTYDDNYLTFENLLRRANKVFMMDAYLHYRTITWLELLGADRKKDISLIQRKKEFDTIDKIINKHNSFYTWFNQLVEDLVNGKKSYLFYPYKTGRGSVLKLSIDGLKKRIIECVNIRAKQLKKKFIMEDNDIIEYHGDVDDCIKNDLIKVNEIWNKYLLVITNSCITVGVSYDLLDFDKIYLGYADLLNPRDVIQSSMRVRKTKEKIIEFYAFPNVRKILAKKNKDIYKPNPVKKPNLDNETLIKLYENGQEKPFFHLRNFLSEEYNAKSLEILNKFFIETGYKINDEYKNTNDNPLLYRQAKSEELGIWDYSSIPSINENEKNELEMKVFEGNATMKEKLKVNKYYIECSFFDKGWDNEEKVMINRELADNIKETFYLKPNILFGFRALWNFDKILNYALKFQYGEIIYNHDKLTDDDKIIIENHFHLVQFGDVGKLHKKKFLNQTDYIIKKHIIQYFFGSYIIQRPKKDKKLIFSVPIISYLLKTTNVIGKKAKRLNNPNRYSLLKGIKEYNERYIYPDCPGIVHNKKIRIKNKDGKLWSVEEYKKYKNSSYRLFTFAKKIIPVEKSTPCEPRVRWECKNGMWEKIKILSA
jgi:hypothetical protein